MNKDCGSRRRTIERTNRRNGPSDSLNHLSEREKKERKKEETAARGRVTQYRLHLHDGRVFLRGEKEKDEEGGEPRDRSGPDKDCKMEGCEARAFREWGCLKEYPLLIWQLSPRVRCYPSGIKRSGRWG